MDLGMRNLFDMKFRLRQIKLRIGCSLRIYKINYLLKKMNTKGFQETFQERIFITF